MLHLFFLSFFALYKITGILQLSHAPTHSHYKLCVMLLLMFIALAADHVVLKSAAHPSPTQKSYLEFPLTCSHRTKLLYISRCYTMNNFTKGDAVKVMGCQWEFYWYSWRGRAFGIPLLEKKKIIMDFAELFWLPLLPINSHIILSW